MAHATDMNPSPPMPNARGVRAQMEGMATAVLYTLCFAWIHLGSKTALLSAEVLGVFFVGLIVIPLLTCVPVALVRRFLVDALRRQSSVAGFLPFATFALYALQGVLVWVATREAYAWVFASPPIQ